jgi:hypothetical protein
MSDRILLKMAQTNNTAGKYRPQLLFLKPSPLSTSLAYLIIKCSLGKLKQCIHFVESRAILIFSLGDNLLQRNHILATTKLTLSFL